MDDLQSFALLQYNRYSQFRALTLDDIKFLFRHFRDVRENEEIITRKSFEMIVFLQHVAKNVGNINETHNQSSNISEVCKNIILARSEKFPCSPQKDVFTYRLVRTLEDEYKQHVSFQLDHEKLHVFWVAYWDHQLMYPSIYPSIDMIKALTDCDGISFAINIELMERGNGLNPKPWYERIIEKEGIGNEFVMELYEDPESRKLTFKKTPLKEIIENVESDWKASCQKSDFRTNAYMMKGMLIYPKNRWLVQQKIPAHQFLSLNAFHNIKFPTFNNSFICTRGATRLVFKHDDTFFQFRNNNSILQTEQSIEGKMVFNNTVSLTGKDIIVQGIVYASMDISKVPVNKYARDDESLIIKIRHNYNGEFNDPIYACPITGVPSDMEVIFPNGCTFTITNIDRIKKIIHMDFVSQPLHHNKNNKLKGNARHEEVFLPGNHLISKGGSNLKRTICAITGIMIILASSLIPYQV